MAEVTSGDVSVIVLNSDEAAAFVALLQDWVDDSFSRGVACVDGEVIAAYNATASALREVLDAFGVVTA